MQPTVETRSGRLAGVSETGVSRFLGIPFAEPPVVELRWRPPVQEQPWQGTRDATRYGTSAPQAEVSGLTRLIGVSGGPTNEDCLYLNVWTPATDAGKRPVMFWVHGGANTIGSGAQPRFNGEFLTRRGDVVVVTCNYRLGALGFLHAPELGATGNEALLDLIAGLRWVRENIDRFGGDPDHVTLFGQSAGGFNIGALMAMQEARGLYHKAIPMSGSISMARSAAAARETTAALADHFGGMEKLRAVASADILKWQLATAHGYGAVVDGTLIARPIEETIAAGGGSGPVPLLVGTCETESALWTAMNPTLQSMTADQFQSRVKEMAPEGAAGIGRAYSNGRTPVEAWTAIMTDRTFRLPAIRLAELHGAHTKDVWMYLFDYRSPAMEGKLGSVHSLDIPFVFGTFAAEGMDQFCGSGAAVSALSATMMDTYLAFARSGNPAHTGLPAWPRYDKASRTTMRLGPNVRVEDDPLAAERGCWNQPTH